jgi:hypothetical protein
LAWEQADQHLVASSQVWLPGQSEVVPLMQFPLEVWHVKPVVILLVVGLQTSGQTFGGPAVQTPFWQVSLRVHWLPSRQVVPLARLLLVHFLLASQMSEVQELLSLQSLLTLQFLQPGMLVPLQVPLPQVSLSVQGLLSLQEAVLLGLLQTPPLHTSLVQGLLSLQSAALLQVLQPVMVVPLQVPEALHWSPLVQALLSSQLAPLLLVVYEQSPLLGLQVPGEL